MNKQTTWGKIQIIFALAACFSASAAAQNVTFKKIPLLSTVQGSAAKAEANQLPPFATFPSTFTVEQRDVNGLPTLFIKSPTADIDGFLVDGIGGN